MREGRLGMSSVRLGDFMKAMPFRISFSICTICTIFLVIPSFFFFRERIYVKCWFRECVSAPAILRSDAAPRKTLTAVSAATTTDAASARWFCTDSVRSKAHFSAFIMLKRFGDSISCFTSAAADVANDIALASTPASFAVAIAVSRTSTSFVWRTSSTTFSRSRVASSTLTRVLRSSRRRIQAPNSFSSNMLSAIAGSVRSADTTND
mmetsp:Transcript_5030/g.7180  ORF Transcript_5030/g.7180 Transcript_5030/m.7180 type:complete len:208 (+) Transcript_5030:115-738(+)